MNKTQGILRIKSSYQNTIETPPDLLVFGYQSKLYRDDVKALELDREIHLIPAPYDKKEMISRYDVRATLEVAPEENCNSYRNRTDYLPPAEQQAEMMAEKERYFSLYTNEVEEEMYKEEQFKRELSDYNQVAFSYDESTQQEATASPKPSDADDNDSTPFTPSVKLDLPVGVEPPPTLKINQIIEKTAKFISSQGPQMEILLKMKQAANPQFNFLNHDDQYNAYYKHCLAMMKAGTYPWPETTEKSEENSQDGEDFKVEQSATTTIPQPAIIIPKMIFKPSADCAYTQLISKITKAPIAEIEKKTLEINGAGISSGVTQKSSGLVGLVHYSSDSESEQEEDEAKVYTGPIPPAELQLVIDKTAVYVAKNGTDFEDTLRKKQDSRFEFLDSGNEFNKYYQFKVVENGGVNRPVTAPAIHLPKVPPAPVCFSIKPKEDKSQLKPSTTLASSDDEKKLPQTPMPPKLTSVEEELEMQVDAMNAEREEKMAKEKLKDKLLNAAREKLGMLPKEKMLQIERKKKAMMFINQIKGSNGGSTNGSANKDEEIHSVDDSDDSVKSIPIASTSSAVEKSTRSRSRKRSAHSKSRSSYSSSSSSRSRSSARSRHKRKKSKSHRRKKKYRRRSRSRSRSRSKSRSRSRSYKRRY